MLQPAPTEGCCWASFRSAVQVDAHFGEDDCFLWDVWGESRHAPCAGRGNQGPDAVPQRGRPYDFVKPGGKVCCAQLEGEGTVLLP